VKVKLLRQTSGILQNCLGEEQQTFLDQYKGFTENNTDPGEARKVSRRTTEIIGES
jgi:hypothetical protein